MFQGLDKVFPNLIIPLIGTVISANSAVLKPSSHKSQAPCTFVRLCTLQGADALQTTIEYISLTFRGETFTLRSISFISKIEAYTQATFHAIDYTFQAFMTSQESVVTGRSDGLAIFERYHFLPGSKRSIVVRDHGFATLKDCTLACPFVLMDASLAQFERCNFLATGEVFVREKSRCALTDCSFESLRPDSPAVANRAFSFGAVSSENK